MQCRSEAYPVVVEANGEKANIYVYSGASFYLVLQSTTKE